MATDLNLQAVAQLAAARPATKAAGAPTERGPSESLQTQPAETQSDPPGQTSESLNGDQLNDAVDQLNSLAQGIRRELRFSVDDDTGRTVITVKDLETDQVIRQVPPEQVLTLISHFQELQGSLFQETA